MLSGFIVSRFYELRGINILNKIILVYLFMSLGGMPPFLGFLGKICVLKENINNLNTLFLVILVLTSLSVLYLYISRSFFLLRIVPYQKIIFRQNIISYKISFIIVGLILVNYFFLII